MYQTILTLLSLSTLGIGCIGDIKHREVSNVINGLLLIFLSPLIVLNWNTISIINWLAISLFAMTYALNGIGGADLKALIPIILSLDIIMLMVFVVGLSLMGLSLAFKYRNSRYGLPYYVAITVGYLFVVFFNMFF